MSGKEIANPINPVNNPNPTAVTINNAQTHMGSLFLRTALKLVTTAVIESVFLAAIIGSEKALMQKTSSAKREPTREPIPRNKKNAEKLAWAFTGKKICIIEAARAQIKKITNNISANINWSPTWLELT